MSDSVTNNSQTHAKSAWNHYQKAKFDAIRETIGEKN
jgi:hypothetical protein